MFYMANIQVAYNWAIEVCNKPNVGYSQQYRNQRTVNGITYYDCSSFIWYALIAGGWDLESKYYKKVTEITDSVILSVVS